MAEPSSQTINLNDVGYDTRKNFVENVIRDAFNLMPSSIEPIAYEHDFPFPYNNFVYLVDVGEYDIVQNVRSSQPGTDEIPKELRQFIMRLPNAISGYNDEVRVENEVASLQLARQALQSDMPGLVPRVFGWESSSNNKQGWILQEYMTGEPLMAAFNQMSLNKQRVVLEQMADILACFQRYALPSTVTHYGGLTFDSSGAVRSAPMSIQTGGPFEEYEELVLNTIRQKLRKADRDRLVKGWEGNGIRASLNEYLDSNGLQTTMKKVKERRKVLVHADFSTDNLLYDPQSMKLTAILDFDFTHIGSVADEFFRSLGHEIGRFPDPRDGEQTRPLNEAMLNGFPDPLPPVTAAINWPAAKIWNDALISRHLHRPSTIPGFEQLSELFWLSSQLLPFKLTNEVVVRNSSTEQLERRKTEGEALLRSFLEDKGF